MWKQPECPLTNEWIKIWCVYTQTHTHTQTQTQTQTHTRTHTHTGILLSHKKECMGLVTSARSGSLWPYGLWSIRLLCPWDSPGKTIEVGCCALLHRIFPTQESNLCVLCLPGIKSVSLMSPVLRHVLYHWCYLLLLLLSCFSRVRPCVTP